MVVRSKKLIKSVVKVILTIAALYFVFSKVDFSSVQEIMIATNEWYLFGAFLFFNFSKIVGSVRLNIYFKHIGVHISELYALKLYYIGMFYNLFLPGGIGGDGYKIYLLNKNHEVKLGSLLSTILLDRLSGLIPLLFFAGMLFFASAFYSKYLWLDWFVIVSIVTILPLFYLLNLLMFKKYISLFFKTLLLGSMVQILQLFSAFFIVYAMGYEIYTIVFLTLFLLSSVMAVLPISIGGVGVRELTFLYGLNIVGVDADAGIAFSLLFFLITASSSLIGVFLKE